MGLLYINKAENQLVGAQQNPFAYGKHKCGQFINIKYFKRKGLASERPRHY